MHENGEKLNAPNGMFSLSMVSSRIGLFFGCGLEGLFSLFPLFSQRRQKIRGTAYYCTGSTIYSY